MRNIIFLTFFINNLFAFTANCTVYPSEDMSSKNPWKFSIVTGQGKLVLYNNELTEASEPYFLKNKDYKGNFTYANNQSDYIEIILGKIQNNKLNFSRFYTNGDTDIGTCVLRK
jgi:hypothetical protein